MCINMFFHVIELNVTLKLPWTRVNENESEIMITLNELSLIGVGRVSFGSEWFVCVVGRCVI